MNADRLLAAGRALGGHQSDPDPADLAAASLAIARRFAAGGTLWCAAPRWPWQAERATANFARLGSASSHPRPAATLTGDDPCEALGPLARAGDTILLVSRSDEPSVTRLRQRTKAWGATTIWVGAGPRPEPGAADYVLWVDEDETCSSDGGMLTRLCDLLCELTAGYLEAPSLLEPEQVMCKEEVCITCSDEGRIGEVVAIQPDGCAEVRTPTGLEEVDTTLVDGARPGDLVLIHAGTAVAIVEDSAA